MKIKFDFHLLFLTGVFVVPQIHTEESLNDKAAAEMANYFLGGAATFILRQQMVNSYKETIYKCIRKSNDNRCLSVAQALREASAHSGNKVVALHMENTAQDIEGHFSQDILRDYQIALEITKIKGVSSVVSQEPWYCQIVYYTYSAASSVDFFNILPNVKRIPEKALAERTLSDLQECLSEPNSYEKCKDLASYLKVIKKDNKNQDIDYHLSKRLKAIEDMYQKQ